MPVSFDKKITDKIRKTFESHEEAFNEHAWELMKEKLGKNKKRGFVWVINIAKAASVILVVGLSIMIPFKISDQNAEHKNFPILNDTSENIFNNMKTVQDQFVTENDDIDKTIIKAPGKIDNATEVNIAESKNENSADVLDPNKIILHVGDKKNIITAENNMIRLKDTINHKNSVDSAKTKVNKPNLGPGKDDFFIKEKREKKVHFGIAVSSHMTSSEIGANDFLNVGGGFLTEYMLSKHLSISSGLYVSNHNLDTDNSFFNFGMKDDAEAVYANDQNTLVGTDNMYSTSKQVAIVGLDIPINLNYNFEKFFISAGVSSLIYLKENLTENFVVENAHEVYNSSNNTYETVYMYDNLNNTTKTGALRTFDFAKLFNLSVGYRITLKKGRLVFEPYAKIPIGKLTSYDIAYGYGGFALKYEF